MNFSLLSLYRINKATMKKIHLAKIILIYWICMMNNTFAQDQFSNAWNQVDSLEKKGLYNQALSKATGIFEMALANDNSNQIVKSSLYQLKYNQYITEDDYILGIHKLQSLILEAKAPTKQILHSLLAEIYYGYYARNRWKFNSRTAISDQVNLEDIRTWDLERLASAIINHYQASLLDKLITEELPLKSFETIIQIPNDKAINYYSLYDFLVDRAFGFFSTNSFNIEGPAETFLIDLQQYFGTNHEFKSLDINTNDSFNLKFYAVQTLQELTTSIEAKSNPFALFQTELKRLKFAKSNSILSDKDARYIEAIERLTIDYKDQYFVGEAWYEIALNFKSQGDALSTEDLNEQNRWEIKKAAKICQEVIKNYPKTYGAGQCRALFSQIQAKDLKVSNEITYLPQEKNRFLITYKNVNKVHFKIVKVDHSKVFKSGKFASFLAKEKAVFESSISLNDKGDFLYHTVEGLIPELELGHYYILVSDAENYMADNVGLAYAKFWVTQLTYQTKIEEDGIDLIALCRKTGHPIENAEVKAMYSEYNRSQRKYIQKTVGTFKTNAKGKAHITGVGDYKSYYFSVKSGDDHYEPKSSVYYYKNNHTPSKQINVRLYTDRKLYRPGQTIYFKGIAIENFQEDNQLMNNFETVVEFYDVNYQKIESIKVKTNEFGSFEGKFTAPYGVLTGSMQIKTNYGGTSVQVEEYKRPKFSALIKPIEGEFQLNDSVPVTGVAEAFAGNKISGAKVVYRVQRTTRFNYWYWSWRQPSSSKEVLNGTTETNEKGEFSFKFKAIPDETTDPKTLPIFNYTITADIIDINGETHSATKTFSLGYQSLVLSNSIKDEINVQNGLSFSIGASSLNGDDLQAQGTIKITKLKTPSQTYVDRLWSAPDQPQWSVDQFQEIFPKAAYSSENDYLNWTIDKAVYENDFDTKTTIDIKIDNAKNWSNGVYRYVAESKDKKGVTVKDVKYFTLFDPGSNKPTINEVFKVNVLEPKVKPGSELTILLSTAEKHLNVFYSIDLKGDVLKEEWLHLKGEQTKLKIPIEAKHIGGFSVDFLVVKNNRTYHVTKQILVPKPDHHLSISFESFRNKLLPGQDEEWTLIIKNAKDQKVQAELLASLYDASLDELFASNTFDLVLNTPYYRKSYWAVPIGFGAQTSHNINYSWNQNVNFPYRSYPSLHYFGYSSHSGGYYGRGVGIEFFDDGVPAFAGEADIVEEVNKEVIIAGNAKMDGKANGLFDTDQKPVDKPAPTSPESAPSESPQVKTRKNFNETAFFYPQLHTNAAGEIKIKFTIPESLTKWRLIGLAHSKDLEIGNFNKELITQKELMVMPNMPRFLRESDQIELSTKISNLSKETISGEVTLLLFDPVTETEITEAFNLNGSSQKFSTPKDGNTEVSWVITVPVKYSAVKYQVIAKSLNHSDGEENVLPILSNRMLVTESLPMPINGARTKTFKFKKLLNTKSTTLKHHNLALEFTSNPAWYAIQAMPYMMEYPYECAEQTFTRYYSNAIATHVMNSNPRIKQVIEAWGNTSPDAFLSNLNKNKELKALMLEETPWVLNAKSESETKKNLAILLDINRMSKELDIALSKTIKNQSYNGGWAWFPGMRENRYITQHIITGMGHLNELGIRDVKENRKVWQMVEKGIKYLDQKIVKDFESIKKNHKNYLKEQHLNYIQIQYLYMRSYFPEVDIDKGTQFAVDYFSNQAKKYWLNFNLYAQGMIGLSAKRMDLNELSSDVYKSLKDRAIITEEFGMYWKSYNLGFYWYQAPIETQALMVEFFNEMDDQEAVEQLKIWLLKEKQTTHWKTTKQTTEAVYALLLNGIDLLASEEMISISVGGKNIEYVKHNPSNPYEVKAEAGTGYFKTSWQGPEVNPEMGEIKITKKNKGISWGAMYWQYFENLDKITFHDTPLKLNKTLYKVELTNRGERLALITTADYLKVGDKIRVRIELRTDRNLEYVHMKDMRASALEPLNVISSYHYQDGLGYYQATKDAAINFFFDFIPKGTYVFEYDLRVQQNGDFSNGIATIQCMYAPEFTSHSEGIRINVKP